MAFNPPNPDAKPRPDGGGSQQSSGLQGLVQAEKLMQIALVLPCAAVIGWGAGWWFDHHFGLKWVSVAGLVLGLIAGMVSAVRLALEAGKPTARRGGQ
jgi:F0F1-type ATP synthase assembly protein I